MYYNLLRLDCLHVFKQPFHAHAPYIIIQPAPFVGEELKILPRLLT